MQKTEQEKLFLVKNTTIYWFFLSSLRRDCVKLDLTLGGLVRVPHAPPPVSFDLYVGGMI